MKHVLAYIAAMAIGATLAILNIQPQIAKAFDLGYASGLEADKPTVRQLVLSEPKYVSQLCKNWWFDMTIKDRKL